MGDNSNPGWKTGKEPTAAEWASAFSGKVDAASGYITNGNFSGGNFENPGFTGTISGNPIFNGVVQFTGGGSLAGTFSGSPTWSGNHIFSGNPQFQGLLNVRNGSTNTLALNLGTSTVGNDLSFNGAAGNRRAINWQTAGVSRWRLFLDASDNWTLGSFDTAGANFSTVMQVAANPGAGASNSTFLFGNAATITLSGAGAVGFNFKHAYTGSLSSNLSLWQSAISSDQINASGVVRGHTISHTFGGGSANGARIGLELDFVQAGALTNGSNAAFIINASLNNPGGTSWVAMDSQLVGQNWNLELKQGALYVGVFKAQGEVDITIDPNVRIVTVGTGSPNGTTYNLSFTTTGTYQTGVGSPISVAHVISVVGGASDTPTSIANKLLALVQTDDVLNQGGIGAQNGQTAANNIFTTGLTRAFALAYADWVGMTCTPSVSGGAGTLAVGAEMVGAGANQCKGTMYVIGGNHGARGLIETTMWSLHGSATSASGGMLTNLLRVEGGPGGGGTWPLDPFATCFQFTPGGVLSPSGTANVPQLQSRMYAFADMRKVNFTASAGFPWLSPGFSIDGSGNHQIGGALISRTTRGISVDAPGWEGTSVINSGGSGTAITAYFVNDIGYDLFGGQYLVTAVNASGVITTMTTLVAPSAPSGSAPAGTQAVSGGSGSGWTVTVTWNACNNVKIGSTAVDTVVGKGSAGATNDVLGHLLIPFVAGAPVSAPTNATQGIALRYDTTNHKLWAYDAPASAWRGVVLT